MNNRIDLKFRFISLLFSVSLPLVILLIGPNLNDVFSLPKFLILCFLGLVLLFVQIALINTESIKRDKTAILLVFFFISSHLFLSLSTDQTYRALIGYYGRNNGFFEYLFFAIFLVSITISATRTSIEKTLSYLNLTVTIISIYAILQSYNFDLVKYAPGEFSEVTTLGNVNFSSALIGMCVPISFWKLMVSQNLKFKLYFVGLLVTQLYGLIRINSTQGKILAVFGCVIFLGLWLQYRNKRYFNFYLVGFLFVGTFSILGLFQKGPFGNLVYESSISFRGDYFRAAWRMFLNNPLSGVGIESFSDFYLRNTDLATISRVGAESTTQYAHNIFLQFMATGGLFLTLPYLLLILYISFEAIRLPKRLDLNERLLGYAIISIWFLYLAQLQISIEHPALGLLGWIVGGLILNLRMRSSEVISSSKSSFILKPRKKKLLIFLSTPVLMIFFFLSFNSLIADANLSKFNALVQPSLQNFHNEIDKRNVFENYYKVNAAVKLANSGNLNEANILLFEAVNKNPNDIDAIYILAQVSNLLGKKDMEIIYREKSFILNPYLDENIYKLALIYKELNQITNLNNLISRVSARPGSSEISLKLATLV